MVLWKDKIDKSLARLPKEKRERTHIKSEMKRKDIINDTMKTQEIIRNYYEQVYTSLDNLE